MPPRRYVPFIILAFITHLTLYFKIVAKEGTKSLFKGAGANILRGVAGAGVLSLYDKLQQVMFGKVYSGGM